MLKLNTYKIISIQSLNAFVASRQLWTEKGLKGSMVQALDVVMETVQADFLISWYKFFGNDISHITCVNWSGAG